MKRVILVQKNWDGCQQGDGLVTRLKKKLPVCMVPQANANANNSTTKPSKLS